MYVFSGKSAYDDGLSNYIFVMAERRTFPRVNGWRRDRGGERLFLRGAKSNQG